MDMLPHGIKGNTVRNSLELSPLPPAQVMEEWNRVMGELDTSDNVTLIVNDATRPASAPMIAPIEHLLEGRVRILFATGTHRSVTEEEKDRLLGGLFPDAQWRSSDCDSPDMVYIGETGRGTPVMLDPWLFEGTPVLSVNSVEPHYFAGYTGGRKSFLPGVSSRETIRLNHFHACSKGADPGRLDGNPVHLDMMEALGMLMERVNVLQGNGVVQKGELVGFFAGDPTESFHRAVSLSSRLTTLSLRKRSPLVIVHPGKPLDISLYQAEKAIYNCCGIVEDGGCLLLVSECSEGLGADHMERAFATSMAENWEPPSRKSYRLGDHSIVRLRDMRGRFEIGLCSSLSDDLLEKMGIMPVHDIEALLSERDPEDVLVIPGAGFIVPSLNGEEYVES